MYTRSAVNAILAQDLDSILLGLLDLLGSNSLVPNNKEFRRRVHPLTHLPVIGLDEKLTVLVKSHAFCLLVEVKEALTTFSWRNEQGRS